MKKNLALYIHIPFCEHKCIYCDFYSITKSDRIDEFTKALIKEIDFYADLYSKQYEIITIFFGGGTPTALPISSFYQIVNHIFKKFDVNLDYEFTIEANPNSAIDKLSEYKKIGVNRISFGIQSFNDDDLKFLTRVHTSKQAIQAVEKASETGFENINIDLIFNLPNQSLETIQNNLKTAISLPIKHISYYSLILENGTKLFALVSKGLIQLNDENYDIKFYNFIMDFLENSGFEQYEVSNFAKKGYKCRHNLVYWKYGEYLGLGPSAHSFIANKRFSNYRNISRYIDNIKNKGNAIKFEEILSLEQNYDEYLMLSLRSNGLHIEELRKYTNNNNKIENLRLNINKLVADGFLKIESNIYRFTKKGYAVADKIIENLL